MKVLLIPVVNPNQKIIYNFTGEKITATLNNMSDVFDFSSFQVDGVATEIETTLPINPIGNVKRENGILFVQLINFIEIQASESEKFPEWVEV